MSLLHEPPEHLVHRAIVIRESGRDRAGKKREALRVNERVTLLRERNQFVGLELRVVEVLALEGPDRYL